MCFILRCLWNTFCFIVADLQQYAQFGTLKRSLFGKTCDGQNQMKKRNSNECNQFVRCSVSSYYLSLSFSLFFGLKSSNRGEKKNKTHRNFWSFIWLVYPQSFRSFRMELEHSFIKSKKVKRKRHERERKRERNGVLVSEVLFSFIAIRFIYIYAVDQRTENERSWKKWKKASKISESFDIFDVAAKIRGIEQIHQYISIRQPYQSIW